MPVCEDELPEDTLCSNCARCGRLLLARGQRREAWYPEFIAGRCQNRPYCVRCLPVARTRPMRPANLFTIPTEG